MNSFQACVHKFELYGITPDVFLERMRYEFGSIRGINTTKRQENYIAMDGRIVWGLMCFKGV